MVGRGSVMEGVMHQLYCNVALDKTQVLCLSACNGYGVRTISTTGIGDGSISLANSWNHSSVSLGGKTCTSWKL